MRNIAQGPAMERETLATRSNPKLKTESNGLENEVCSP